MTSRRYAVSVSVVVAVGVLGLSACSNEKPSGVAPVTPSVSSSGPSPTRTSKWTPEQQHAIDGYDRYDELITRIWSKAEQINMAKVHTVAKEPFATTNMKAIDATLSAGFVETGETVNTISSVTVAGDKATIKTCLDLTHTKLAQPSAPPAKNPPPSQATVSLSRQGDSWLVADLKAGEGACVSG